LEIAEVSRKSRKKRIRQKPDRAMNIASVRSSTPSQGRATGLGKDFQPDYTYVIEDLKRIAVLAGSFVVILIILSFFLR
jgi:hypothetical protein